MVLKRVGTMSCAKISGAMYVVFGFLAGLMFALISLFGAAVGGPSEAGGERVVGALFGIGAIVFLPVLYGILGFLGGLLVAAIYNRLANVVGGVELELQ